MSYFLSLTIKILAENERVTRKRKRPQTKMEYIAQLTKITPTSEFDNFYHSCNKKELSSSTISQPHS